MRRVLLTLLLTGLFLIGCASDPEASGATQPVTDDRLVALERPVVLRSNADLDAFVAEFSSFVREARSLRDDLRTESVEAEAGRIEGIRNELSAWEEIQDEVVLEPENGSITPEAYTAFVERLDTLRDELWEIVLDINREIADESAPVASRRADPAQP